MAPRTWHGAEHQLFFMKWMPVYIRLQAQQKLYKFWGPMFQDWFNSFPEETFLGWPLPGPDAPPLPEDRRKTLGTAISGRKQKLENYFRNNRAKMDKGSAKRVKSEYALARALFKAKAPRKRVHKAVEIFQLRNPTLIREECTREGHDSINEESMAPTVVDWVNEDDDVQVARIKAAQAARMRLRNRVVHALFAEASEEELGAIAEVLEREKDGEIVSGSEDDDGFPVRSAVEYQASIDESWDVMKKVHKALEKMTGWYGFSMWGGPNPRIGGELSMKSVSFGFSPVGLDYEASHPDFEKAVSVPFQLFLRRCFPPEVRITRSLDTEGKAGTKDADIDPDFRLSDEDAAKGAKKRPKRMTKAKKNAVKVAPPTTATSPTTNTIHSASAVSPAPIVMPTTAPAAFAEAATTPPVPAAMSSFTSSFTLATPESVRTHTPPHPTGELATQLDDTVPECDEGGLDFNDDIFGDMDDVLLSSDFGVDDPDAREVNMPPLPVERPDWRASVEALVLPAPSTRPSTPFGAGLNFPVGPLASSQEWMGGPFSQFPQPVSSNLPASTQNPLAPVGAFSALSSGALATNAMASVGSSPVPARFRRHDEAGERLPPLTSSINPIPPTLTPTLTPTAEATAPRLPVLPQSRPSANIPKPALAAGATKANARGRGGRKKLAESEAVAKTAAKAAGKKAVVVAGKKAAAGKKTPGAGTGNKKTPAAGKKKAAAPAEEEGDDDGSTAVPDEGVLADASNMLIYTTTNNSIKLDRELKARRAAAAAAKAPVVPNCLYNPDGPSDLVIVPAPNRPRRERHPTTNSDNTIVALPVKRTLAQMRAANNSKTENALLARTGHPAIATSSNGADRKR